MEVVEDIDINHSIDTKEMGIDERNEVNANASDGIHLWSYVMKQQTEKAKYSICGVILSRKHAATSGLSMHLHCQKIIWTLSMLTLWRRFHNYRKIFFKHPIHHSIALKLYFIVRVKIFIKKRSLMSFFMGFFVKPLIFCPKKLFGYFHYFLSPT